MNPQQAENLLLLADFLARGVPGRFNMDLYYAESLLCGTRACALGWACTLPALNAQGLVIGPSGIPTLREDLDIGGMACRATEKIFGLTFKEHSRLFSTNGIAGRQWDKPTQAAAEMYALLAEKGYHQSAKPNDFARFMAKVREPVSLDAVRA